MVHLKLWNNKIDIKISKVQFETGKIGLNGFIHSFYKDSDNGYKKNHDQQVEKLYNHLMDLNKK